MVGGYQLPGRIPHKDTAAQFLSVPGGPKLRDEELRFTFKSPLKTDRMEVDFVLPPTTSAW